MLERVGLGRAHTFSWPAEPRFSAQGQTGWLGLVFREGQNRKHLAALSERPFGEGRRGEAK